MFATQYMFETSLTGTSISSKSLKEQVLLALGDLTGSLEPSSSSFFSLVQRISMALQSAGKSDRQVTKASQDVHDLLISSFEDFFPPGLIDADPETKAKAAAGLWVAFGSDASTKADRLRRLGWSAESGRLSILESVEKEAIAELLRR